MSYKLLILFVFSGFSGLVGAQSSSSSSAMLNCRIEPSMVVEMSSAVEGVISEVLVDKNDYVKQGDVVAKLEASLEQATVELRQLQADLISDMEAKQLALDFSERTLKRVNDLYTKKAASFSELDKAKTEFAIAEQKLQQVKDRKRQAKLEYKRALADLRQRTLVSPIDGTIIDRYKQPGEHIDFDPVLKIAQLDPLHVEVYAPASLFGKVKEGMVANVTPELGLSDRRYRAEVLLVDQVIDGPSNTFAIRLSLPNHDNRLPSGLKCKINFEGVNINLLN